MALINGNSIEGLLNLFRNGKNDRYVLTPDVAVNDFRFNQKEQYISINGNESDIFRTTPQLAAVLYRRAMMLANGNFIHLDKNGEIIENSAFVKLLEKPNPFQAKNEWLIQQDIQKNIFGNSFIYMLKGSQLAEVPKAIWNIEPAKMMVELTGNIYNQTELSGIVKQYKLNFDELTGNSKMTFTPQEILHRNIQDVDSAIIGTSPLNTLRMPISNIRAAYGFRNVLMLEKGAIGMITNESKNTTGALPLTEAERTKIEKQFSSHYGITEKQRKVILTTASLKWQPMTFPTREMMLFEEIDENFKIIIDYYGLDEALFSVSDTTFENKLMAEKNVYQDTILPEAADLSNGLTNKFGLDKKGEKLVLDYSHLSILQDDKQSDSIIMKNKADAILVLQQSGLYTNDEIKSIVELN